MNYRGVLAFEILLTHFVCIIIFLAVVETVESVKPTKCRSTVPVAKSEMPPVSER